MKACKYCGHETNRNSDEDCPAKLSNKVKNVIERYKIGWVIVLAAVLHEATHLLPFLAFWLGWSIKGDCH